MADKALSSLSRYAGLAGLGIMGAQTCLYNVDAGYRAVLFDNLRGGIQDGVRSEGTHLMVPFIQSPRMIEVRTRPKELPSITGTKDLQTVQIKLRVLWRPREEKLPDIYRRFQDQVEERVLPSIGNEVLKMVVAQYNAAELLSKRAEVSDRIREELIKRAQSFDLIFDDVAITHLNFGVEYMRAIESKQVAQQEAEKQLYVVEKAEQIRQATVIRAEGEAESANMITAAVEKHGEGILEMKRIDAAKQIAKTLSRSNKVTYLPSGGAGGGGGPGLLMSIDK